MAQSDVLPEGTLAHGPEALDRRLGTEVARVGLQLDPMDPLHLERVAEPEVLHLGVDRRPPDGRVEPGADLDALVLAVDVEIAEHADRAPSRRRHDRERENLPTGGESEELVDERRHLASRSTRTDPQVPPDLGVAAGPR